jgi:hypothetical protein
MTRDFATDKVSLDTRHANKAPRRASHTFFSHWWRAGGVTGDERRELVGSFMPAWRGESSESLK